MGLAPAANMAITEAVAAMNPMSFGCLFKRLPQPKAALFSGSTWDRML
jgi:hypothetical protein